MREITLKTRSFVPVKTDSIETPETVSRMCKYRTCTGKWGRCDAVILIFIITASDETGC